MLGEDSAAEATDLQTCRSPSLLTLIRVMSSSHTGAVSQHAVGDADTSHDGRGSATVSRYSKREVQEMFIAP